MKSSKYNYIVPFEDNVIFFNGITESFFFIGKDNAESIHRIIENPNSNMDSFRDFIIRMVSQGFIVPDNTDELESIKKKHLSLRKANQYYLMVLPTYQCNLRCWYCTQEHSDLNMTDETIERIKHLINRKLSDTTISEFHLSWFGGEPLMAYKKVLELTSYAKSLTKELNKGFSSSITTNGTLLTPERIEALHVAGIGHYQITIDGDRNTHNLIKKLGKVSAYDRTLDNINLIAKHTSVNIRFNYTCENLKPDILLSDLLSKLNPTIRDRVNFTLFKVWQEDKGKINSKDLDKLFENGIKAGLHTTLSSIGICYADRILYDCIFPNGRVGKCDNHNPEGMPGILMPDGSIEWEENMTELYEPHIFDSEIQECSACRYLPICWGPCVSYREKMLRKEGKIKCHRDNPHQDMQELIIKYCKTKLQQTH